MRDDLLEALASVDWAVSKLPDFRLRLETWAKSNTEIVFEHSPAEPTHEFILAVPKDLIPLEFNVEAGVYINTIRSSLDILACAIGKREMVLNPNEVYFPVAGSADDFARGNYRGCEFVRAISRTYRDIIENSRPYQGGNDNIWACHYLDIIRKHRRLLTTSITPAQAHVQGFGLRQTYEPLGFITGADGKTVLGKLRRGAERPKVYFTPHITLSEPECVKGMEVSRVIDGFARMARAMIDAFDIA